MTNSTSNFVEYGPYQPKVEQAFLDKVKDIGGRLDAAPEYLMAVMGFETGGSYSPSIRNPHSSATGLIQFLASTAKGLGTSTAQLAKMSALEQLDFVEKYLLPYKGKFNRLEDTYMAVLWPKAVGKGPDYVLFSKGSRAYSSNAGLDENSDGAITAKEATNKVRKYLPDASLFVKNTQGSSTEQAKDMVRKIYLKILGREVESETALNHWTNVILTISERDARYRIAFSEEAKAKVKSLYQRATGKDITIEEAEQRGYQERLFNTSLAELEIFFDELPQSPIKNKVVDIARQELAFFNNGTLQEHQRGAIERVNKYWSAVGRSDLDGADRNWPWSAAFISWVMKQAGAGDRFKYSASHSTYIGQAVSDRKSGNSSAAFIAYRLSEYAPQVGDLVGYARQSGIGFDSTPPYKSHTDIVVAVRNGEIDVIGGNKSHSVTLQTLKTDSEGRLLPTGSWFVVLKNQLDE